MEFKIGDVVHLKGGGKRMTVSEVKDDPEQSRVMISCLWFESSGGLGWGFGNTESMRSASFDSRILEVVDIVRNENL